MVSGRAELRPIRDRETPVPMGPRELRTLVDDMFETMYDAPGIGLAAPQIGVLKAIGTSNRTVGVAVVAAEDLVPAVPREGHGHARAGRVAELARMLSGDKVTPVSQQSLSPIHTQELARSIMTDKQAAEFEATNECNFAISPSGIGRFRVNAFVQQGQVGVVLRVITTTIPGFDDLKREYRNMYETYGRIFTRLGLEFRAVAADTGTAIRGNLIDLWMPSTEAARAWGRRTVTITVYG